LAGFEIRNRKLAIVIAPDSFADNVTRDRSAATILKSEDIFPPAAHFDCSVDRRDLVAFLGQ